MVRTLVAPVSFVAVVLMGLIAGLLVGTAMEQHTLRSLSGSAWITARHSIDALFSRVMPWVWNLTLVVLFLAAAANGGRARWLFLTSGLILLLAIVVTVAVEVPMNKQIAAWDAGAVPANWAAIRDRWLQFHTLRTVAGGVAFACAVLAGRVR
ncbi:MAG TPA: DUF1772 domain-containing protein [Acidobacteriaceae bacterium]|nr:DUF1772 domain-containing protein [Acidobacteriaceae bacterium]